MYVCIYVRIYVCTPFRNIRRNSAGVGECLRVSVDKPQKPLQKQSPTKWYKIFLLYLERIIYIILVANVK